MPLLRRISATGAPLIAQARSTSSSFPIFSREFRQVANLTNDDVSAVTSQPGIGTVVGIADSLSGMQVSDRIGLRSARVSIVGVDGDLSKVLYSDLYRWVGGERLGVDAHRDGYRRCNHLAGLEPVAGLARG